MARVVQEVRLHSPGVSLASQRRNLLKEEWERKSHCLFAGACVCSSSY